MTPSELSLALIVLSWTEWPGASSYDESAICMAMHWIGDALKTSGFVNPTTLRLTSKGAALVSRYREHMAAKGEPL